MTLNCYKFKFSQNFAVLHIFGRPIYQGCCTLIPTLSRLCCKHCWTDINKALITVHIILH